MSEQKQEKGKETVKSPVNQLTELCQKILDKLPKDTQTSSTTQAFEEFLEKLKDQISDYEIRCIRRAYNYFNQLMQMEQDKPTDKSDPSALTTEKH